MDTKAIYDEAYEDVYQNTIDRNITDSQFKYLLDYFIDWLLDTIDTEFPCILPDEAYEAASEHLLKELKKDEKWCVKEENLWEDFIDEYFERHCSDWVDWEFQNRMAELTNGI